MSGFQGRRVADPRPVVRGDIGNEAYHTDGNIALSFHSFHSTLLVNSQKYV